MNPLLFTPFTKEQLREEISAVVKLEFRNALYQMERDRKADDFLTRKEVAQLFKVNLSTVHNWCKKGSLKPFGIGNRVYFKRSEIEQSLTLLNSFECGRTI